MNKLSVIIPSKTESNLRPCIDAIRDADETCRVIVVWDGDAQSMVDLPPFESKRNRLSRGDSDAPTTLQWVLGVRPFIFARNVNIGIRAAGDSDVILLNDDALLKSPLGFTKLQQVAADNPSYGVIGAVTNITGQPLQWPHQDAGTGSQSVVSRRQVGVPGLREVFPIAYVCILLPHATRERLREATDLRKKLHLTGTYRELLTGGYLDERYTGCYGSEDRDLNEQLKSIGMKVGVYDYCYVDHGSLRSTFRGDARAPGDCEAGAKIFADKWGYRP